MRVFLLTLALVVAGCGGIRPNSETPISTELVSHEYNDIRNSYMEQPTFVELVERYQAGQMLTVYVDQYGSDAELSLPEENASKYLPFIDKYLEWESLATERGDTLDREIGSAPGWHGFKINASIFSGGPTDHYLVLEQCVLTCLGSESTETFYFDRKNARILRELLVRFQNGELESIDYDEVYK